MPASFTVKIAQRGLITLPQPVREAYHIEPGDVLTLLDLDGVPPVLLQMEEQGPHHAAFLTRAGRQLAVAVDLEGGGGDDDVGGGVRAGHD